MRTVNPWQILYGNVEEEDSPTQSRGFQTLRLSKTSGIDAAELASLEARLVYSSDPSNPAKRVFHVAPSGKVLLAQARGVPGRDREGRTGRYLAHGLVFDAGELPEASSDVFAVFRQFPFVEQVGEALDLGDRTTGDIERAEIALADADIEAQVDLVRQWGKEFKKLSLLALAARRLRAERQMVLFVGAPPEVESAIEAAFAVLPDQELAVRCTFDTYFEGCNPVSTYYWGVGMAKASGGVRFVQVDARSRRVVSQLPFEAETSYERWVSHAVDSGRIRDLVKGRKMAYAVCEWLDGREAGPTQKEPATRLGLAERNPDLIESVVEANPAQLGARLLARLEHQLPPRVAQRVFKAAESTYLKGSAVQKLRRLRGSFPQNKLYDTLYETYRVNDFQEPPADELRQLELCEDLPRDLRLIVACWKGEQRRIKQELRDSGPREYQRFLEMALVKRIGDPVALLIEDREREYMDLYLSDAKFQRASPPCLVDRLLELERADLVPALASKLEDMSSPELAETRLAILRRARGVADNRAILELVYQILCLERFPQPSRSELASYRTLVSRGRHQLLSSLVACWRGRDKEIQQKLAALERDPYRQIVHDALCYEIGNPRYLITEEGAPEYVKMYRDKPELRRVAVADLVDRLLDVRREDCLSQLTSLLNGLQWSELRQIRRRVDSAKVEAPPAFLRKLDRRILDVEPWLVRLVNWLFDLITQLLEDGVKAVGSVARFLVIGISIILLALLALKFLPDLLRAVLDLFG